MGLGSILLILFLHFFADFILQNDYMAQNKSSSNKALGLHVLLYSLPFIIISPLYALINGIAHFITDYISSRITKKLWQKQEVHWFFVVIGLDQLAHYSMLFSTFILLGLN